MQVLSFPSSVPEIYTVLRFSQYTRKNPHEIPTELNTAMLRLPLPYDIVDEYGMTVNADNLGTTGFLVDGAISSGRSLSQMFESGEISESFMRALSSVGTISRSILERDFNGLVSAAGAAIPSAAQLQSAGEIAAASPFLGALAPQLQDAIRSQLGIVRNPQTTLMFEGVNLKSFTFQWKVAPRNLAESNDIHAIFRLLKQRMHPAKKYSGYVLDYPDIVQLSFKSKSSVDLGRLPVVRSAFITGLQIDHMGSQTPAFFKNYIS